MALYYGTLGNPDGSATPARLRVADCGAPPQLSREAAIAAATRAGVLGAAELMGPIAAFDGGELASGMDAIDFACATQDGGGDGVGVGSFGWGVSGFGTGCGTIGGKLCQGYRAGPFATIGERGGDGRNLRMMPGFGPGRASGSRPRRPSTSASRSLAPTTIRAWIRRSSAATSTATSKISYCYEKELLGNAKLEGTVTANFTLDGNGAVIESRAGGVSPEVSSRIASVVSNIHFPKVGGTGIYPIKYPFVLRPAGS